jgi:hypothetical protein
MALKIKFRVMLCIQSVLLSISIFIYWLLFVKGGIEELRDVIGQQANERGPFSEDNTRNERKSPSTKVDKNMEARVAYTRKSRMVFSVDMTAVITFITKSATWSAKHGCSVLND